MTRARTPRPHEVDDARRDERLLRALRDGGRDPAWRARGACQTVDPEMFFPAPSEPADAAVALCRTCPVQGSCLAWALQVGDLHGVWGGTTARERRAMAVVWRGRRPQEGPGSGTPVPPLTAGAVAASTGAVVASTGAVVASTGGAAGPGSVGAAVPPASAGTGSGRPGPGGAGPGRGHVPAPRPGELPDVGPAMDRAELLRLVRAG